VEFLHCLVLVVVVAQILGSKGPARLLLTATVRARAQVPSMDWSSAMTHLDCSHLNLTSMDGLAFVLQLFRFAVQVGGMARK
jgi:hypothetical protein